MPKCLVEELSKLEIVILRHLFTKRSDVIVAYCDGFKLTCVHMIANTIFFNILKVAVIHGLQVILLKTFVFAVDAMLLLLHDFH